MDIKNATLNHSFRVDLAQKFGIHEALFLESLRFWIIWAIANDENLHDGKYWIYNKYTAWATFFPYFNDRQIKTIIKNLEKKNIIKSGNFNKVKYDQTKWYTFSDDGLKYFPDLIDLLSNKSAPQPAPRANGQNCLLEETKLSIGMDKNVRPIPITNTSTNTYIKDICAPEALSSQEYPETLYPLPKPERPENSDKTISLEKIQYDNPHSIPPDLIQEWQQIRKAKRAPITLTAWNRLNKELAKFSGNKIEAFEEMVSRGWSTFKCDWMISAVKKPNSRQINYNATNW